jgi:hypothetical protein
MQEPSQSRLGATIRGVIISVLIATYAYVVGQPGASFTATLLIAAALQVMVLLLRKFVPPALMPQALQMFELAVDAATVFLFALGVFGGILKAGAEV